MAEDTSTTGAARTDDSSPQPIDRPARLAGTGAADHPILRIDSITAGYGTEPVLHDISLTLARGEILALVGPNGSGKSTALKVALGQLRPTSGDIAWFQRPITDWPGRQLARRVAYLPQSPSHLPGQSVADVLAAGRAPYWGAFGVESKQDHLAVARAAELLGVADWLGRDVDHLSGGQRQRVYIARCVAQVLAESPDTAGAILLDEPDTHLDLKHAAELAATLRRLARGRGIAILLASHDLNLAAGLADRLALLSAGRVTCDGPPAVVLTEEHISAAYGTPVRVLMIDGVPVVHPERDLR